VQSQTLSRAAQKGFVRLGVTSLGYAGPFTVLKEKFHLDPVFKIYCTTEELLVRGSTIKRNK